MYSIVLLKEQQRTGMSNISINQASKIFKVSRNTIYARLKSGEITKNSDGNISVQDMIRLFGHKVNNKITDQDIINEINLKNHNEHLSEQAKNSNEQELKTKIAQLEQKIEQLEEQLNYVKANESWLKQQLEQKLIEHKSSAKKGLLGRIFSG